MERVVLSRKMDRLAAQNKSKEIPINSGGNASRIKDIGDHIRFQRYRLQLLMPTKTTTCQMEYDKSQDNQRNKRQKNIKH